MFALKLDENGRILSATYLKYAHGDMVVAVTLPEGNISDYRMVDGEYIYDPEPVPEEPVVPTAEERIAELETALELLLSGVTE